MMPNPSPAEPEECGAILCDDDFYSDAMKSPGKRIGGVYRVGSVLPRNANMTRYVLDTESYCDSPMTFDLPEVGATQRILEPQARYSKRLTLDRICPGALLPMSCAKRFVEAAKAGSLWADAAA